jgi:paraquat-inducible protein A
MSYPHGTAAARGLALCHICLRLDPVSEHHCGRCGSTLHLRHTNSLQRTLALLITACILYIPANVLPIMNTVTLGKDAPATILGGVMLLIKLNDYPIAAVIFIASVLVPLSKLTAMFYLVWSVERQHRSSPRERTVAYRLAEFVGRWSMVDVFVVAVLVALIQLGGLMSILPGPAALAFAGVVVFTMLAAESFDPRLIWDQAETSHD